MILDDPGDPTAHFGSNYNTTGKPLPRTVKRMLDTLLGSPEDAKKVENREREKAASEQIANRLRFVAASTGEACDTFIAIFRVLQEQPGFDKESFRSGIRELISDPNAKKFQKEILHLVINEDPKTGEPLEGSER